MFDGVFEMWWPKLEEEISRIIQTHREPDKAPNRSERDMLEEILELTRVNTRSKRSHREVPPEIIVELAEGIDRMIRGGHPRMLRDPEIMFAIERPLMMLAEWLGHPELREFVFRMRHRFEMISDKPEPAKGEKS